MGKVSIYPKTGRFITAWLVLLFILSGCAETDYHTLDPDNKKTAITVESTSEDEVRFQICRDGTVYCHRNKGEITYQLSTESAISLDTLIREAASFDGKEDEEGETTWKITAVDFEGKTILRYLGSATKDPMKKIIELLFKEAGISNNA